MRVKHFAIPALRCMAAKCTDIESDYAHIRARVMCVSLPRRRRAVRMKERVENKKGAVFYFIDGCYISSTQLL